MPKLEVVQSYRGDISNRRYSRDKRLVTKSRWKGGIWKLYPFP